MINKLKLRLKNDKSSEQNRQGNCHVKRVQSFRSNSQQTEMMFVCQQEDKEWTLYSATYGHYSPKFESLNEMKELIQEDWLIGEISQIDIYNDNESDE